jgi:hypothetical protein
VAKDDRTFKDEVSDTSSLPVMHIAPAYARLSNMDTDVVWIFHRWDGTLLDGDLFDCSKDECRILVSISQGLVSRDLYHIPPLPG